MPLSSNPKVNSYTPEFFWIKLFLSICLILEFEFGDPIPMLDDSLIGDSSSIVSLGKSAK
jgi:hypothetical protein